MHTIRDLFGHYPITGAKHPLSEEEVLQAAQDILYRRLQRQGTITRPTDAADYLRHKLSDLPYEVFGVLWLDTRNCIIGFESLFTGTLAGASVYAREVVRAALHANAAACILCHNHPSGQTDPSSSDLAITEQLKTVLRSVEVRLPNLASVLKDEVTRLCRKELREEVEPIRKAAAAHRQDLAEVKRQLAAAQRRIQVLEKRAGEAHPLIDPQESGRPVRFVAKGVRSLRPARQCSSASEIQVKTQSGLSYLTLAPEAPVAAVAEIVLA